MKNLMLALAIGLIGAQVSASPIIQCKVLKDGRSIVHSLSLNQKARRDFSSIWGPAKSARFFINDKEGQTIPMTLNVQLDGENLLAVSLFKGTAQLAQRREVISSSRPFSFYMQSPGEMNVGVSCARN